MVNITSSKWYNYITGTFLLLLGLLLSISISMAQIALGVLLLCLIIYIIDKKVNIIKDNPYSLFFIIYWCAVVLSSIFGSDYLNFWKGIFSPWHMLIFFTAYCFIKQKNINYVILAFGTGIFIMTISCYYYYIRYGEVNYLFFRSRSIVAAYMMTAHLLSIGIIFLTGVILSGIEKNKKIIAFYIVTILLASYALFITATRMPMLAVIFVTGLMFIFKFKLKGFIIALLLFLLLIVYFIFDPYMSSRFNDFFSGFNNPATSHGWRFDLWKNSMVLLKDYPVFGIGEGAFEKMITPLMPKNIDLPLSHAHNSFVMQLVTHGIAGFIAYFLFYGKIYFNIVKNMFKSPYAFTAVFISIGFILEAVTENNFGLSLSSMQNLFLLGILTGAYEKKSNSL